MSPEADPEDQNKIPVKPLIGPGSGVLARGVSDSKLATLFDAGHSHGAGGVWQPPSSEELQHEFPQYEIRGILGHGGMGAVYKGWQKSLQRFVAIKILPPVIDDGGMDFAERFKQEARAMAKFKHPGIVTVHDAGETHNGLLYFIMEFIEGTDVAHLVATRGKLTSEEALRIASRVCEAVAYAHERGVIHRDIKPSNVMIEADGTVKVADFGLAKLSSTDSTVNTQSSLSVGTPDFMPPEGLHGLGKVDHRGDIYAVGGMLYQMLTGKAPHGRFERASLVVRGLDKRLDAIVDKAMQADPSKRYSSAIELQAAIEVTIQATSQKKPLLFVLVAVVALTAIAALIHFAPWKRAGATAGGTRSAVPQAQELEPTAIRLWDSAEKLPQEQGVRWDNNAVRLDGRSLDYTAVLSRDAIVRVEVRMTPDEVSTQFGLRYRQGGSGDSFYRVGVNAREGFVVLSSERLGKRTKLQTWPLPRAYAPDEWLRLELHAKGDEITVIAGGQTLGTVRDTSLVEPGGVHFFATSGGYFRNIVYVPLDKLDAIAGGPRSAVPQARELEPTAIRLWDSAEKLPQEQGVRWENNAVRLDGRSLRYTAVPSRDAIVRAEVRMNPDEVSAQFGLRYRPAEAGDSFYLVEVNAREGFAVLSSDQLGKRTKLQTWPLPRGYAPDEWLRLELHAVGDEIAVIADGQTLGTVRDTSLVEPGGVHFFAASGGYFRNIVYVPLDKPGAGAATNHAR